MDSFRRVPRRRVAGLSLELSSISIAIDPSPSAGAESDALAIASLRRAWERGVTTFDLSGARAPERAELLLATAFPDPDPERTVILRGRTGESAAAPRGPTPPRVPDEVLSASLAESVAVSSQRMKLVSPPLLVAWRAEPGAGETDPTSAAFERLRSEGIIRAWAMRLRRGGGLPPLSYGPARHELFSGPLSLVERALVPELESRSRTSSLGLIATDPFAGGLLDGTRFSESLLERPIGVGPVQLRKMQEEFAPVLSLGFLTEKRRRTLSEAALLYALHWPWVATVAVPLPAPERLDRLLDVERATPLSAEELERLDSI